MPPAGSITIYADSLRIAGGYQDSSGDICKPRHIALLGFRFTVFQYFSQGWLIDISTTIFADGRTSPYKLISDSVGFVENVDKTLGS